MGLPGVFPLHSFPAKESRRWRQGGLFRVETATRRWVASTAGRPPANALKGDKFENKLLCLCTIGPKTASRSSRFRLRKLQPATGASSEQTGVRRGTRGQQGFSSMQPWLLELLGTWNSAGRSGSIGTAGCIAERAGSRNTDGSAPNCQRRQAPENKVILLYAERTGWRITSNR